MSNCKTRREFDEIVCGTCGLRWSVDDEPPECTHTLPKLAASTTPLPRKNKYPTWTVYRT